MHYNFTTILARRCLHQKDTKGWETFEPEKYYFLLGKKKLAEIPYSNSTNTSGLLQKRQKKNHGKAIFWQSGNLKVKILSSGDTNLTSTNLNIDKYLPAKHFSKLDTPGDK